MRKISILLSIFTLITYSVDAQNCGTTENSIPQHFPNTVRGLSNDFPMCINIKFHIVNETNGTGGFDSSNILQLVSDLNNEFNPHNIFIRNSGIDYINDTKYYHIDDDNEFDELVQINYASNAINFYLVKSAPYAGRADGILSNSLVTVNGFALSATSAHEVGHCLNLWHTFQGTSAGSTQGCPENIDGSNCSVCGDYVCDTPADANTGNNGGYMPDLNNIMSYYSSRNQFTDGQGYRMRAAILNSTILQPIRSNECSITYIEGENVICDTSQYTYTIENIISGTNVTWDVPNEFNIVSSSNTDIDIELINNPSIGETVVLKAILPSHTLEKIIRVGEPAQPQVDGPLTVQPSYTAIYEVLNHTEGSEYSWSYPNGWDYNPNMNGPSSWGKPTQSGQNGNITVNVTNDCGSETVSFYVTSSQGGGGSPKSNQNFNFKIYPNPASNILYIENNLKSKIDDKNTHIVLLDRYGNLIKDTKSKVLDLNNLPSGIYFVKVTTIQISEIHTLIIKK